MLGTLPFRSLVLANDEVVQMSLSVLVWFAGSGPIILDDVSCTGGEESLLECNSSALLGHNCIHAEDAGVICPTGESKVQCVWCSVVWCSVVWCGVCCGVMCSVV